MEKAQKIMLARIAVSAALLGVSFIPGIRGTADIVLCVASYLIIGGEILWEAVSGIFRGRLLDESFLMSVATVGAVVIGQYPEAAAVMLFFQVGELFQDMAVGRSRASISALMDIRPDVAGLEENGQIRQVPPDSVARGSVIVVKPGEKIPLDGVVIEGRSSLNTTALTGESLPRDVAAGDSVLSGCVNMTGPLRVRTTGTYGESTVARILELVENSDTGKADTEKFITRFARVYTPAVVGGAVLLALIPSLITGQWTVWLNRALIFLVISCPCALVVSVPLSFFGGIGGASRRGILVKGSNFLEALARAETVVFDKTGTLTKGSFTVTVIHPEVIDEQELLGLAAMAESYSDHPISQSLRAAWARTVDASRISDVEELAGMGIRAVIDGRTVFAGNSRLMESRGIQWKDCGHQGTIIHVALDGVYVGHIVISDEIKPRSREAIGALRAAGVRRTVMLTGDRAAVGKSVARELGLDEEFSELLPGGKVEQLERLMGQRSKRGRLVFVGDGINDAPVLRRADVGVAMGALGSDAAIEAADVVLMDDDPSKVAEAIRISRRTLAIVKQNIVFALGVKLITLVLGATGLAGMWLAVFADVGVAFLAVLNALRAMSPGKAR